MLKFSFENSKLKKLAKYLNLKNKQVVGFDLPAGWTCKMANICLCRANRKTGKLTDGKNAQFRCYAASGEAAFSMTRHMRWSNFDALRKLSLHDMVALIEKSLPLNVKVVRIHSSGDYFSLNYFHAWLMVALLHPEITFFGYSKILDYVRIAKVTNLPNFKLTYSFGGKQDAELKDEPTSYVVKTIADGKKMHLPVSCVTNPTDDFDFIMAGVNFALPIHGTQKAGFYK